MTPSSLASEYDFARAIWLPEPREPVTLFLGSGEKVPGRVVERKGSSVVIAVVVPVERRGDDLNGIVLEYANPCGRVRLTGKVSMLDEEGGLLLGLAEPDLLEVVQERDYVRVGAECSVQIVTGAKRFATSTVDISAGGLLLADPLELVLSEDLEVDLAIVPGTPSVVAMAQVARIDAEGRAGVEFTSISDSDRWRLLRFTLDRVRLSEPDRPLCSPFKVPRARLELAPPD